MANSDEFFSNMNHVDETSFLATREMLLKRVPSISNVNLVADTLSSTTSPTKASATWDALPSTCSHVAEEWSFSSGISSS
ncbi:hypothetical protein SLA2020_065200 [Shorea laevis]